MNLKISNMRKIRIKFFVILFILLYILYVYLGVSDYVQAKNFDSNFDYPLNIDIKPLVNEVMSGKKPSVAPINYHPYRYLTNSGKCNVVDKLDLFIVVKSAMKHFEQREAIRQTYGQENFLPGRVIKILFFLGIEEIKTQLQKEVETEMAKFKDIIQMDFHDTYFNNTIKTMMSFRWVYEHCSTSDYYLFTDDDMYISVSNLLEYLADRKDRQLPTETTDSHLFSGYVFKSSPHRIISSKWRVSLEEYPWNKWPPYVTAGAYVVSNKSMNVLYIASLFVKHFRFDDIYLGIVAKKAGIIPEHCDRFHFYKKKYSKEGYRDVIASHGYGDREELLRVWNEQHGVVL